MDATHLPYIGFLEKNFIKEIKTACFSGLKMLIVTKSDEVYGRLSKSQSCYDAFELSPILELHGKKVKKFFLGDEFFIALTEKGELFSWSTLFLVPTIIPSLSQEEVIDVACGPNHAIALCSNRKVYSWRDCSNFLNHNPELVSNDSIGITCTASATFFLTTDGEVHGHGTLFYWFDTDSEMNIPCIGDGNDDTCRFIKIVPGFRKLVTLNNIKKIIGGKHHVMALDNDGVMFIWGKNEYGQMANEKPYFMSPEKFSGFDEKIIDIAANSHTDIAAAMTVCSRIYVWGGFQGESFFNPILTSYTSFNEVFSNLSHPSMSYGSINVESSDRISCPQIGTLKSIFNLEDDSDLTIVIEEKNIFVHKVILKARSKYFQSMFTNQWKENDKKVLKICGYSYESFKDFLSYLYSGIIDITLENIFELMNIADRYSDENLLELIKKKIQSGSISGEIINVIKEIMKLSSSDYEKLCSGMKKMMLSPISEYLEESEECSLLF